MRRINTLNKDTDAFGAGKHGWKNGVPGTVNRPTEGQAEWFNAVQEELASVVEAAEMVLAPEQNDQVRKAIQALAGQKNVNAGFVIYGDGVTDVSAQIAAANDAGRPVRFVGVAHIGTPATLVVPVVDEIKQLFSVTSQINVDNGQALRPEWFGSTEGNIRRAVNALPAGGGVIKLANRRYPPSYSAALGPDPVAGVDYLAKANVTIRGEQAPTYRSDLATLEKGSIIDGPFFVHADGFKIDKVGIDSGSVVTDARYAGADKDCFMFFNPGQSLVLPYAKGVSLGHLVTLCRSVDALGHACLLEHADGATFDFLETCYGVHGFVNKSRNVVGTKVQCRRHAWEEVIVKSDDYADSANVQISEVCCGDSGTTTAGIGVQIYAATANVGAVTIGAIHARRKDGSALVHLADAGKVIVNASVGLLQSDGCAVGWTMNGDIRCCRVGDAAVNGGIYGVAVGAEVSNKQNSCGRLTMQNMTNAGLLMNGSFQVESLYAQNMPTLVSYGATGALMLGAWKADNIFDKNFTFAAGNLALTNGWTDFGGAGNDVYNVEIRNGKVRFDGLLRAGAGALVTIPAVWRPSHNLRLYAVGYSGSAYVALEVLISTAGAVSISNAQAGGAAYNSLQGVEFPIPF